MPTEATSSRLIVNQEGGERQLERKSLTEILQSGSMNEIYNEIVEPFVLEIVARDDDDTFPALISGKATLADLGYHSEQQTAPDYTGAEIGDMIRVIDAFSRVRFPAYEVYNPLDDTKTVDQRVGQMGQGLLTFYGAAGRIATILNDTFSGSRVRS